MHDTCCNAENMNLNMHVTCKHALYMHKPAVYMHVCMQVPVNMHATCPTFRVVSNAWYQHNSMLSPSPQPGNPSMMLNGQYRNFLDPITSKSCFNFSRSRMCMHGVMMQQSPTSWKVNLTSRWQCSPCTHWTFLAENCEPNRPYR